MRLSLVFVSVVAAASAVPVAPSPPNLPVGELTSLTGATPTDVLRPIEGILSGDYSLRQAVLYDLALGVLDDISLKVRQDVGDLVNDINNAADAILKENLS